jgi:hypothetical protein
LMARIPLDQELKCRGHFQATSPWAWAWRGTRIAVRGFWHEVTRNSSKLHEVLEMKKRAQAMYVHCGIRIHALRELNLTRNLEYVLGALYLPCPEQTTCPPPLRERVAILQVLAFLTSPDQLPGGLQALSCVFFQACMGRKKATSSCRS